MKPEDRALVLMVAAIVGVAAVGGAAILLAGGYVPDTLPIPAGTTFSANVSEHWAAHFSAGPLGGRVTAAWTAYDTSGFVSLVVLNGTVAKPWPPPPLLCPLLVGWSEMNGTADVAVGPGPHTVYWSTGYCASAASIVLTQPLAYVGS